MPRRTHNTRQRIIEAAVELFYAKGYAATGMAEILEKAGANSGSFYFLFKSKEQLLDAVLEWYLEHLDPILIRPIYAQSDDPLERVFLLLDGYRQKILMTDFDFTCPIGRLALEIDPAKRNIHEKIAANFAGWTAAVRKCLDDVGPRLPKQVDRGELAQFVLTVMEGGVMQARSHHDIRPFDASVLQLKEYLGRLERQAAEEKSNNKTSPRRKK